MVLREKLTKQNFWIDIESQYPDAVKDFYQWLDKYKEAIDWNLLFGKTVKFNDVPYEFQQGIWIEFVRQNLSDYFEQPEYEYSGDLEEDIRTVFHEIETIK